MIRTMRLTAALLVLYLLQTAFVHRFTHDFLRPDLLYLAAIFLALEADWKGALWGGFAVGLLRDLGSGGRIGASALLFVAAAGALLSVRGHLVRERPWTDLLLTFAAVLACGTAAALARAAVTPGPQCVELLKRALGQAAFTTAMAPLVFVALHRAGIVAEPYD